MQFEDMLWSLFLALLPSIFMGIAGYVLLKIVKKELKNAVSEAISIDLEPIIGVIKPKAEAWLNSEQGQQAIVAVGALLGAGIKSQIPILGGGKKLNWKDAAAQIAMGAAQKYLKLGAQEGEQPSETSESGKMGF